MEKYYKCAICNELITDGTVIPYKKNRHAHEKCFNIAVKSIAEDRTNKKKEKLTSKSTKKGQKAKAELKDPLSEEDYQDKRMFYGYLRDALEVEPNPKIYVLVDRYISQMNCTYKGLFQTLVYLNEVIKKELTGDVVGLLPYYYEESQRYYRNLQNIENNNADISVKYSTKVVKIRKPTSSRRQEINMDGI